MRMRLFHCTLHDDTVVVSEFDTDNHLNVVRAFLLGETSELCPGIFFTKEFRSSDKVTWVAAVGADSQKVRKEVLNAKEIVFK